MKFCNKCGIEKDDTLFSKRGKILQSECKECCKIYRKNRKKIISSQQHDWYRNNSLRILESRKLYAAENKDDIREYHKKYRFINKYILYISKKQYREKNKATLLLKSKTFYKNNKSAIIAYQKKYIKRRRNTNFSFRLKCIISSSISRVLKLNFSSKNNKSCLKDLPFSMQELKEHIEKQFALPGNEWMNLKNYGRYNSETWNDNDQLTWVWNLDHIIPHSLFAYSSMEDQSFKECWALSNLRPYSAKQNIIDGNRR